MNLFPAIDLYGGNAVRLYKGNYDEMTVYDTDPVAVAERMKASGARFLDLVDLEGARTGKTPNLGVIHSIVGKTGLFTEVGGGIRTPETVEAYLSAGVSRVILGTAAVTDEAFLRSMVETYGEHIAVGVDIKDGFVAIRGWTERSEIPYAQFCENMIRLGVGTVICTDISRDGAMKGSNLSLYRELAEQYPALDIIASGGVSSIGDVRALASLGLYGAIIGKAYYIGAIDLAEALEAAK